MIEHGSDEYAVRLEKLHRIAAAGVDPYPSKSAVTHTVSQVLARFDDLQKSAETLTVAGRLKAQRGHGGALFADLEQDGTRMQLHLKKDVLGAESFSFFTANVDRGDFLQISGTVFITKMGEKTIAVSAFALLAKSLAPLPEKWHGLTDTEIRYRKRYLDLVSNPEVRNIFEIRSRVVATIRTFFERERYMEVETPMLQPVPGGATARPFVTHHNALDVDLYLRVAPELYLKRLVVGGFDRVFEIARCFRNEGIDHLHNPEFTQIEAYCAYADYEDLMSLVERLLPEIVVKALNRQDLSVPHEGSVIDFKGPYPRIAFRDAILEYSGLDIEAYADRSSLAKAATEKGVAVADADGRGDIMDNLFKKFVRPKIVNPTFVINHPIELSPLAKKLRRDPRYVERFQLLLGAGTELVNAFSELNDPIDQRERFMEQEKLRAGGNVEAQRVDEDFLEALATGMPPTAGLGMGIDRLVAILTDSHSLKEVILFPTLRPEK